MAVKGLFRPHYVAWSEPQRIEAAAPGDLRNVVRIITETGLRIYKELTPMKRDQVDLENTIIWIPDSKMPNGVAEVPLTDLAVEALRIRCSSRGTARSFFAVRIPSGIRRRSRQSGGSRCDERRCRTSGSTTFGRRTRRASAPVAWRTGG